MLRPAACALACCLLTAAGARAAPVLVLDHGRAVSRNDRFLPPAQDLPARTAAASWRARAHTADSAVPAALQALAQSGALPANELADRMASYQATLQSLAGLHGTRHRELAAVVSNLEEIARSGQLTVSRLTALFDTLEANRIWWTTGPPLHDGQRVRVAVSHLTYQYYAGQGIELQMLANFGKANSMIKGGHLDEATELLDELLPLGVNRLGTLAWEYYFHFGGSGPIWTSGLSQGTAIQAYVRAGVALSDETFLDAAHRGLSLFEAPPPVGVRIPTAAGAHYLIYSYAPEQRVINAFIQSLNGLFDVATLAGDPEAKALFDAGNAEAQAELPSYDTGRWSLYDRKNLSSVSYHRLLTGFLRELCQRTRVALYCNEAHRFEADLRRGPPKGVGGGSSQRRGPGL